MGVRPGEAVGADVPVHIEIGDHAEVDELALHEVPGQRDPIGLAHLAGNGELDLARELGVDPLLGGLDVVPQPLAIAPCLRRLLGQHHLRVDDA